MIHKSFEYVSVFHRTGASAAVTNSSPFSFTLIDTDIHGARCSPEKAEEASKKAGKTIDRPPKSLGKEDVESE